MTLTKTELNLLEIVEPYFYVSEGLPGLDFNREIVKPGTNEVFPDGAVGIRVDDDFWAVAALPYKYIDIPLKDIVAVLWPQYVDQAKFLPDSGTEEQVEYYRKDELESLKRTIKSYTKDFHRMNDDLERFKKERPEIHVRSETRLKASASYFVRQYEHLLIAMAHKATPKHYMLGVCDQCNLLVSDRVHQEHYIKLNGEGYEPSVKHLPFYED